MKKKTSTQLIVEQLCMAALKNSLVIGILGEPGIGKTTCLKEVCSNRSDIHFLSLGRSLKPINFYQSILGLMNPGAANTSLPLYHTMKACVDAINKKPKRILLVIDEGGKLNFHSMLEFVHELRLQTEGKLGIIISGPPYMKLTIDKWIILNKPGVEEFARRVNVWHTMPFPDKNDFEIMLESLGVDNPDLITLFSDGAKTYSDVRNKMIAYNMQVDMKLEYSPELEIETI